MLTCRDSLINSAKVQVFDFEAGFVVGRGRMKFSFLRSCHIIQNPEFRLERGKAHCIAIFPKLVENIPVLQ